MKLKDLAGLFAGIIFLIIACVIFGMIIQKSGDTSQLSDTVDSDAYGWVSWFYGLFSISILIAIYLIVAYTDHNFFCCLGGRLLPGELCILCWLDKSSRDKILRELRWKK